MTRRFTVTVALVNKPDNPGAQLYRMWFTHVRPSIFAKNTENHRTTRKGILNLVIIDTL